MCKTCIKVRKAAFAVIRTIIRPIDTIDKQYQEDTGVPKKSGAKGS